MANRDMAAARRFFDKAMRGNGVPEKVAVDNSGAKKVAVDAVDAGWDVPIVVRQIKYLNNIVEQNHRAIKRVTKPMFNFKSFRCVRTVLAGIELMHMIRKRRSRSMPPMRCHSPTNFMRRQDKSVKFEGRNFFRGKFGF